MRPDLITIPEAAKQLGIHPDSLYRFARADKFPPTLKIGSRWRVSVPMLERFLHGEAAGAGQDLASVVPILARGDRAS
jgi:excisionase family DNA binding protein